MKNRMFNKYWTASFLLSIVGFTIHALIAQNRSGLKTRSKLRGSLISSVYHTMNIVYDANKHFFFTITANTQRTS